MSELAKAYEPQVIEGKWYETWKAAGVFHAEPDADKTPYCICIPPPNITGSLHMGHALNNTILDAMTRWHRMRLSPEGKRYAALCLPGTDHAGIATQNVVERELAKEGVSRHDLGRERFIEKCWEWREQYGTRIYHQFERLGCSYDWERVRFTLDESYVDAIMEEFRSWHERGLIYRGYRVVNWDVKFQSAVSDIEVETQERKGKLYHFKYPFADGSGFITIATTRPETLLGDAAVAANPADERYQPHFGKMLKLPLTDREIPLIADEYAKMEFGSGAVKVTPAHDLNDFEAGLRNNLPQYIVIGKDGKMTDLAGTYAGLDRFVARKQVVADMEELGLVEKIEDYTIQTPISERSKEVIEPLLSEQWFVNMKPLAQPAIDAVKDGRIKFIPERYTGIYLHWMENIRDWCISRQLWWGHRIPIWYAEALTPPTQSPTRYPFPLSQKSLGEGGESVLNSPLPSLGEGPGVRASNSPLPNLGEGLGVRALRHVFARTREEAVAKLGTENCWQDEDVLDTWFSSALWPHATLGWPRKTEDLAYWYPTNLLSTAQEILYLWVARMAMTGLDFMGEIPFHEVYVHATVLDKNGERMSKSKGNGIDPIDLIEKYGADATRFSLMQQAGKSQDIKFDEARVVLAGQFCNKLWNASKFVLMNLDETTTGELPERDALPLPDRWILSRLHDTIGTVNAALATYDMDDATRAVYQFFWDDLCDWYIEMAKPRLRSEGQDKQTAQNVLAHTLETTLRLLHPILPFITEEIWQTLPHAGETICIAEYPQQSAAFQDAAACAAIGTTMDATRAIRNLRAELGIAPGVKLSAAVVPTTETTRTALTENAGLIAELARLGEPLAIAEIAPAVGKWVSSPITGAEILLEVGDALDTGKETERIEKELTTIAKQIERAEGMLGNPSFVERATPEKVEEERKRLADWQEKQTKLAERKRLFQA